MIESEWLVSSDPERMLLEPMFGYGTRVTKRVSDRKLRLFAVACARRVWELLTDDAPCPSCSSRPATLRDSGDKTCIVCKGTGRVNRSRRAVEVVERFADGLATDEEMRRAADEAEAVPKHRASGLIRQLCVTQATTAAMNMAHRFHFDRNLPRVNLAAQLRCVVGNPFRPVVRVATDYWADLSRGRSDVTLLDHRWLTPTVLSLACAAYEDRPGRKCECTGYAVIPVGESGVHEPCHGSGRIEDGTLDSVTLLALADALEEAGCGDAALLAHLRGPGPHVRGCHAVDLCLGKE